MGKRHIPENLRRRRKKKSVGAAAVLAACLVLFMLLIGAVIGRYQRQLNSDVPVKAKDFYFTSNFLDGGTYTLAPGSTEVKFTLGNHADDLRFSEMDIKYAVTVTAEGSSENPATVTGGTSGNGTGTLYAGGEPGKVHDAEITVSNLKAGKYTITAVGEGGYSQTLTATIVIPAKAAQLYQYPESVPGEYILLTVWNEGDEAGEVLIHYTGIPDNTNPNMTNWTTGGEPVKVTIAPHESRVFRFFGGTATAKTPEGANVTRKDPS